MWKFEASARELQFLIVGFFFGMIYGGLVYGLPPAYILAGLGCFFSLAVLAYARDMLK